MTIGLIDVDGKLPNLALMKISSFYKALGEEVEFIKPGVKYEEVFASCLFSWNKAQCEKIKQIYPNVNIGGTGWDLKKVLPKPIEDIQPDYDLYTTDMVYEKACKGGIAKRESKLKKAETIVNMGIGFTSRGCVRSCGFCVVPEKEGKIHKVAEIRNLINPRSENITLYDNNLTADPDCLEKLKEIRERGLCVNISQGIDVRLLTEEKAIALSRVKHFRSLHYAWDLMDQEEKVIEGIKLLTKSVKTYKHMCFVLSGYNTTFEEDMYRVVRLSELGIKSYIMKFNNKTDDKRLNHFAGWINGRYSTVIPWNEYLPWIKAQEKESMQF